MNGEAWEGRAALREDRNGDATTGLIPARMIGHDSCPLPDSIVESDAQKSCPVASQKCQRAECRNDVTRFEMQYAEEDAIAQRRGGNQEAEAVGIAPTTPHANRPTASHARTRLVPRVRKR